MPNKKFFGVLYCQDVSYFSSEISTRGQKLTLEGNFLVSPTFLGCVPPLHLTVLLNIEPLESEIWPWPKWFLLPFFQGSDKINSFIYSWLVWLNENLLFSFGFYYIKENILFGLVSFMVLRFFSIREGGWKGGKQILTDVYLVV